MVLFATSGTLLADLHIFAFGSLLPTIRSELGLSNASGGLLAGASLATLALLRVPAGILIDRRGARLGLTLGLAAMGAGSVLRGLATGPLVLVIGQLVVGYGIAQAVVTAPVLVNQVLPRQVVGRGMAVLNVGFGLGALVGSFATPRLALERGWRAPLWLYGAIGLVLAALWVRFSPASARPRAGVGSTTVLRDRRLWLLSLQMAAMFGAYVGLASWLPSAAGEASASSMVWVWPVGYLIGAAIGGLLVDRSYSDRLLWIGPMIASVSVVGMVFGGKYLLLPAGVIVAAAVAATFVVRDALVAAWFPPSGLGLVFGCVTAVGATGATLTTVLIGTILDRGLGFDAAFAGLGAALATAALLGAMTLVSSRNSARRG